jgi:cytochrome d ubiquinol oxidase subunit I
MEDLLAARCQMGMSLAFHIIFACIGIAMPAMMVIADYCYLKTNNQIYQTLSKRWAKGTAIMFAIGAVSGTVLSFELGLLWPKFMDFSGSIIGLPFALEGFAFFTEAIFLGIYLYGRNKVSRSLHFASGVIVAISGALSAVFVVIANAWMNTPVGFRLVNGQLADIDPIAAMFNPNACVQVIHMLIASYASIGFAVAGIHAVMLLKQKDNLFHKAAFNIAMWLGLIMALAEPISGDFLAQAIAHNQPIKLAAMEGQFKTEKGAPLRILGIPDAKSKTTRFAIEIPYALSILAFHDPKAEIQGLESVPESDWPPVLYVHVFFQIMVMCGVTLSLVSLWALWLHFKYHTFTNNKWFLRAVVLTAPLGIIAVEAGWMVTELGRQPWVVYNVIRTAHAITPMKGLLTPFITFTLLYLFLAFIVTWLLYKQVIESPKDIE